ncbi:ferredoxin--NADP reductase [Streptomyces sp. NPDC048659]|uniref:ferredoxin--NADP reductase n=1 Tax=Streptomyces sp. NPDC048659 TaxID=3155489 RepID=UPI00341EBDE5
MSDRTRVLPVVVSAVVREAEDVVSLVVETADGSPLAPRPGQFLTVRGPAGQARCYSFSRTGAAPRITVKRVPGGAVSSWLCDRAAPGLRLEALPPAGAFTPPDWDGDLLLAAAGSGITPVLAIASAALERGTARVVLVYANRDEASVVFGRELRELAAAHPERLLVHHLLDSVQGRPDGALLHQLLAPYRDRSAYLCGPAPFMDAVAAALRAHGVPRGRIHREVFVSLDGAFAAPEPGPGPDLVDLPADTPASAVSPLALVLDGERYDIGWSDGSTLLQAMLAHGVDAPFSCREGLCGACVCRVERGAVVSPAPGVLTPEDLADGYVLACQALPPGDRAPVAVTYD